MVCLEDGHLKVVPFDEFRDESTGRTRVRLVGVGSEHYKVARGYMIRLESDDLEDPEVQARLADAAEENSEKFRRRFSSAIQARP